MKNIYIISLEPLENRYTGEWEIELPKFFKSFFKEKNNIIQNIHGKFKSDDTIDGGFLNFYDTNIWKNLQMNELIIKIKNGEIKTNSHIFFVDAWHNGAIQIKYISELLGIKLFLHGLWHAGSYDKNDFLGRKIINKKWSFAFEKSLYEIYDYNYFATDYHREIFFKKIKNVDKSKSFKTGLPFNYLYDKLNFNLKNKENIFLFPHRISVEKQVDIFLDLKKYFPQYEFIICQNKKLSKFEYHQLLQKSKFVFSANLQETFGIGILEGVLSGCIPIIPDRLSYSEMYLNCFKYRSNWTINFKNYENKKYKLIDFITKIINNYNDYLDFMPKQYKLLKKFTKFNTPITNIL